MQLPAALRQPRLPSPTAILRIAWPTLVAGGIGGAYAVLMLATGHRDGIMMAHAVVLGLMVLLPLELVALWLRHGAPLPAIALPAAGRLRALLPRPALPALALPRVTLPRITLPALPDRATLAQPMQRLTRRLGRRQSPAIVPAE